MCGQDKDGPLTWLMWALCSNFTDKLVKYIFPHEIFRYTLSIIYIRHTYESELMKVKVKSLIRVRLFVTPWTIAHEAPPSMEFSRQAYWSRLPFPSPGDLPDPGIKPLSPTLRTDALPSEPPGNPSIYTYTYL